MLRDHCCQYIIAEHFPQLANPLFDVRTILAFSYCRFSNRKNSRLLSGALADSLFHQDQYACVTELLELSLKPVFLFRFH